MYFLKDVIDMLLTITCDFKAAFTLGARVRYSLGTNVNTPFLQVPTLEFGHGTEYKVEPLYSGRKEDTDRVPVCTQFL